jgi:hypothetical protein
MEKYCKDCKYFYIQGLCSDEPRICRCGALIERDVVTGQITGREAPKDPYDMRDRAGRCGPDAKLFEPLEVR